MPLYMVIVCPGRKSWSEASRNMFVNIVIESKAPDFGGIMLEIMETEDDLGLYLEELGEMFRDANFQVLGFCTEITPEIAQKYAKSMASDEIPLFVEIKPVKVSIDFAD